MTALGIIMRGHPGAAAGFCGPQPSENGAIKIYFAAAGGSRGCKNLCGAGAFRIPGGKRHDNRGKNASCTYSVFVT